MIPLEHIHPMLVHFPIVLFLGLLALDLLIVLRGQSLVARSSLPNLALAVLLLGTAAAVLTAFFGEIALETAVQKGFAENVLETHEGLGWTTVYVFLALAALRLLAWWRRFGLAGGRGWSVAALSLAGVALVIVTAYHGGELVFQHGVNVAALR